MDWIGFVMLLRTNENFLFVFRFYLSIDRIKTPSREIILLKKVDFLFLFNSQIVPVCIVAVKNDHICAI